MILIGFPSGQFGVRAVTIFISSAVVMFVVGLAVSAMTASCLACTVHEHPATNTISNMCQRATGHHFKSGFAFLLHLESNRRENLVPSRPSAEVCFHVSSLTVRQRTERRSRS